MPRFAANLTMLFNEVDFLERFSLAAAAGFKGVEFLFPYEFPAHEIAARLNAHELSQVLFNLPPGDWDSGERGIACLPDRVEEFREGVIRALHYAEALNCKQLNCLAGIKPPALSHDLAWQTLRENVSFAATELGARGVTLMLEAINSKVDMPGFFLDTSEKVIELIAQVGLPHVKLQCDIYHMQIMEGDILRRIRQLQPHIGHIQFADNPGRHEPGTGELNFSNIFRVLDDISYDGWVSAEYRPSTNTSDSLNWLSALGR
ncbi:MAG: hydroxypyruvate isomerase [Hahellaceae bacterium]|nr:hydroxypyruvate isomerase [Hahellaceae bacterium]MCP5169293.1 hydroxypyruvate isomerase [Hahellaceae bacterium]